VLQFVLVITDKKHAKALSDYFIDFGETTAEMKIDTLQADLFPEAEEENPAAQGTDEDPDLALFDDDEDDDDEEDDEEGEEGEDDSAPVPAKKAPQKRVKKTAAASEGKNNVTPLRGTAKRAGKVTA
jgi:hypothetical protein